MPADYLFITRNYAARLASCIDYYIIILDSLAGHLFLLPRVTLEEDAEEAADRFGSRLLLPRKRLSRLWIFDVERCLMPCELMDGQWDSSNWLKHSYFMLGIN